MRGRKTNKMSEFSFTLQNGSKFIPWAESSQFRGKRDGRNAQSIPLRVSGRKIIVASVSRFLK